MITPAPLSFKLNVKWSFPCRIPDHPRNMSETTVYFFWTVNCNVAFCNLIYRHVYLDTYEFDTAQYAHV